MPSDTNLRHLCWQRYTDYPDLYNNLCFCCREKNITPLDFHLAHIKSRFEGGEKTIDNIRPTCSSCNLVCQTRNLLEFRRESGIYVFCLYEDCDEDADCGWYCSRHIRLQKPRISITTSKEAEENREDKKKKYLLKSNDKAEDVARMRRQREINLGTIFNDELPKERRNKEQIKEAIDVSELAGNLNEPDSRRQFINPLPELNEVLRSFAGTDNYLFLKKNLDDYYAIVIQFLCEDFALLYTNKDNSVPRLERYLENTNKGNYTFLVGDDFYTLWLLEESMIRREKVRNFPLVKSISLGEEEKEELESRSFIPDPSFLRVMETQGNEYIFLKNSVSYYYVDSLEKIDVILGGDGKGVSTDLINGIEKEIKEKSIEKRRFIVNNKLYNLWLFKKGTLARENVVMQKVKEGAPKWDIAEIKVQKIKTVHEAKSNAVVQGVREGYIEPIDLTNLLTSEEIYNLPMFHYEFTKNYLKILRIYVNGKKFFLLKKDLKKYLVADLKTICKKFDIKYKTKEETIPLLQESLLTTKTLYVSPFLIGDTQFNLWLF